MLVCASILRGSQRCACATEHERRAYVLEAADGVVDISRGELVQLLVVSKDDNRDIDLTKNSELIRLLE